MLFAPSQSTSFAQAVAKHLGVDLAVSDEREYEGGEHKIRPRQSVRGEDVFEPQAGRTLEDFIAAGEGVGRVGGRPVET